MATPVNVSPLIKTARWSLLLLGVAYGAKHHKTVAERRAKERIVENEIKDAYLAKKEAAITKARLEFEKDSILFAKPSS